MKNVITLIFFVLLICICNNSLYARSRHTKGRTQNSAHSIKLQQKARDFIWKLWENNEVDFAYDEGKTYLRKYKKGVFKLEISYLLAKIEYKQGKVNTAIRRVTPLVKQKDFHYFLEANYDLALWLLEKKQTTKAAQVIKASEQHKQTTQWKIKNAFLQGKILEQAKQYQRAIVSYQKVIDLSKTASQVVTDAVSHQAFIYLQLGLYQKADAKLTALLKLTKSPKEKEKIYTIVIAKYITLKEWDHAAYWNDALAKVNPKKAQGSQVYWLNSVYNAVRSMPQKSKQRRILLAKGVNIGKSWQSKKGKSKAEQADFLYYIGWFLLWQNKIKEAEASLHKAQQYSTKYLYVKEVTLARIELLTKQKKYILVSQLLARLAKQAKTRTEKNTVLLMQVRNFYFLTDCQAILNIRKRLNKAQKTLTRNIDSYYNRCRIKK